MQCPICLSESDEAICPVCGYSKSEQSVGPQAPPVQPVVFTPPTIPVVEKPSPIPDPPLAPSSNPTEPHHVPDDHAVPDPEPSRAVPYAYPPPPPVGVDAGPHAERVAADPGPQIPTPRVSPGAPTPRSPWLIPGLAAAALALVVLIAAIAWPRPVSTASEPSPVATRTVTTTATASAEAPTTEAPPSQEPATEEPPADTGDATLVDESFSEGDLPQGWTSVLGDWRVVDGRLQVNAGKERARIVFGPNRPEDFHLEMVVRFVKTDNASRWINIGLDAHIADDWGSVLGFRSNTTAPNGIEVAQAAGPGQVYVLQPIGAAPFSLGVGQDHWISVDVHGSSLSAAIDGQEVLTTGNLAHNSGGFGLIANGATVQFDNIKIVQLSE